MANNRIICAATWTARLLVGCVFVFSGFVKAIDPFGSIYKAEAYLSALSLEIWPNLILLGVFSLCAFEFLVGVFILFGCFRKSIIIIAALIMAFMLPITLWLAMDNPIDDCGCFGDAIKISNWTSFWKNIILCAAIVWLYFYNKRCHWLVTPALQWIAFVVTGLFILTIELFGYIGQPLIDFRQYKIGQKLSDIDEDVYDIPEFVFIYEKNGYKKSFNADDSLPDENDGWKFIERKEMASTHSNPTLKASNNIRIWDKTGNEDITAQAIVTDGKELLIMMPNLKEVSPATTWKLNSLYEWSVKNNVTMAAVVAGTTHDIEEWEDLSMASYPIYTADDTQLKEVVRGNPGVVYLVNGIIKWKSSLTAINIDDFLSPDTSSDAMSFGTDNLRILRNSIYIYLAVMAVLIFLSFTPVIKTYYIGKKSAKKENE